MWLRLWRAILILFLVSVSASAQTSNELKQKYEQLGNGSYLVRPGIILSVSFGENGQACRMQIQSGSSISSKYPEEVMPRKIVDQIVNEFIPLAQRGKVNFQSSFGGCTGASVIDYEKVEISYTSRCDKQGGSVTSARVIWKGSKCWEDYQRKSNHRRS